MSNNTLAAVGTPSEAMKMLPPPPVDELRRSLINAGLEPKKPLPAAEVTRAGATMHATLGATARRRCHLRGLSRWP